jgi:hypothetical protein
MTTASVHDANHDDIDQRGAPSTNGQNRERREGDAPSANQANGRDAQGRFAKGNAGGPGNPFARRMARMRSVLCAAVSEEDIEAVTRMLVERAREGDVAAARLLLAYAVGQPAEAVDPDTLDAQEWQVFRQVPVPPAEVSRLLTELPVDFACQVARALAPFLGQMAAAKFRTAFPGEPEPKKKPGHRCKRRKRSVGAANAGAPDLSMVQRSRWVAGADLPGSIAARMNATPASFP